MVAQTGRSMRIAMGDDASPTIYTNIAGAREDGFSGENGEIDITNKDDAGYRTLLAGGNQSLSLSCSGVTKDNALMNEFAAGTLKNYRITWSDGATLDLTAQIRNFERTGSHEGDVTFSATFESSGAFTFTAS